MAKIDVELADGAKAGETLLDLTKKANQLNKEIKKLKPGSEEFISKSKELQGVGKQIGEVKDQIKGTTEASNGLKDAFDKYVPFSGTFKKIGQELGFVKKGVGGLTGSFGTLRTAIIATGLGVLAVLLGSLISYFTSTQEGIDKVTAVTRPLTAIFQRLKGVLQELGQKVFKQIADAINNPKQAFIDLGKIIEENILNRFKALALFGPAIKKILSGDIKGGFKDLGNAVLQVGTGVENVIDKIADGAKEIAKWVQEGIDAGTRLDKLQKQIERAEINQITRSKQLVLAIKEQKAIVEDTTKSYAQRIAAAVKARALQDEFEKNELNLLDLKIAKIKEEQALNDTSREDEKELAELIAKRYEVQANITEQAIEFDKKITEIRAKQAADEMAAQQKLQDELKEIEDLRLQAKEESRERDLEELQLNLQRQIEILDENSPLYGEHLAAIQAEARKQRSDINAEWDKKDLDQALAFLELQLAEEQNIINENLLNRQITETDFILQSQSNVVEFNRQKVELIKKALGEESLVYKQAYSEFLDSQKKFNADSQSVLDLYSKNQMEAIAGSLNVLGGFMGSISSLYSEGTQQYKSFATASAIISAIQGSIAAYSSTAAIPFIGPLLAPIAAATALAAGYAQVRKINETKVPSPVKNKTVELKQKKEKGGFLRGPRHSQGGIPIEAEGGEFIFSRKSVNAIGVGELTRVNDYYTKYAIGGPINPLAGGSETGKSSQGTSSGATLMSRPAWVDELVAAQDRRIDRIKVINVATETDDVIKTVNTIKDEANA